MLTLLIASLAADLTLQQQDLRCVAAISLAISASEEAQRPTILPLATYYIGRVTGRDPRIDLEAELRGLMADPAAFAKKAPEELARCGREMEDVGVMLQRVGKALGNAEK